MGMSAMVFIVLLVVILCAGARVPIKSTSTVEDADFWHQIGVSNLKHMLKTSQIKDVSDLKAKNIIIFVGDGMGLTTITAGRIFKGQQNESGNGEEALLSFDLFPHIGLAKTYNVDKQVPDSAGTATALFSGIKTLYGVIGLDATRNKQDPLKGRSPSIMSWAQDVGKRTGIVTTTRITHATPAATYAGIYHRDWECDLEVPEDLRNSHVDIARQLVENKPGNQLNIVLGGGLKPMGNENPFEIRKFNFTGDTEEICARGDGRNLTDEWLKVNTTQKRTFIQTRDQLMDIKPEETDYLLGLFRNNHLTYSIAAEEDEPSLEDMVVQAIKILDKPNSMGYVLMVEGGRIDQAHHQNYARAAMHEMLSFDNAINAALKMINTENTLVIVTADHSHSLTFNGYPPRGNDILGFANKTSLITPYETLTYANGPGYDFHRRNDIYNNSISSDMTWKDVLELGDERLKPTYPHLATFQLKDESHGGEDVIVFATGPGSSLIRGVFEQNYVAYVMSYAGCMGPARDIDGSCTSDHYYSKNSGQNTSRHSNTLIVASAYLIIKWFML